MQQLFLFTAVNILSFVDAALIQLKNIIVDFSCYIFSKLPQLHTIHKKIFVRMYHIHSKLQIYYTFLT